MALLDILSVSLFLVACYHIGQSAAVGAQSTTGFDVGVVLDMGSWTGNTSWGCIAMAAEDFYAAHPHYRTRLVLHRRDSGSTAISAASAALDLLKNVQVKAILGPQKSPQAKFVMELGNKAHVPVISFSANSPSLSSADTRYFIRTTVSDSIQAKVISSLVQSFKWRQIVPIFEDTEYGRGMIPYLVDALQANDITVPYRSALPLLASKERILEELHKLKAMHTRVFVVHMSGNLGFQLFQSAKEAGMMDEGYAWITTYGLTDIVEHMGPSAINVMQGALGIRPHIRETKRLSEFKLRWRKKFLHDHSHASEPGAFGLWAYDTMWALAMAIENVVPSNFSFQSSIIMNNSSESLNLGYSSIGEKLLSSILNTNFNGLSGKFHLVSGQLEPSFFEIVNVIDNRNRRIGFWTPSSGISRHIGSKENLKFITWPGKSATMPKGWQWPSENKKLRIGVPVKPGFSGFVKTKKDPVTNKTIEFSGFCIDVFNAVIAKLPYAVPFDYIAFEDSRGKSNGTYDQLMYEVYLQNFDAVVGDATIIANRSIYVDFTLPYTESGVTMVVPVKDNNNKNAWAFLQPMTKELWVSIAFFFIWTGFVIWVFEHQINDEFRGPPTRQLGTIFYFSFSSLVFAHREKLINNLSRFVVVIWIFVVLILTSSYTASLTSMLTVQRLQPTISDMRELIRRGYKVGYLIDSFMPGLLKQLKFDESNLIGYESPEEYAEALNKGSSNGGVAAIIDEIPYVKVFLSKYCGKFTMVGPTHKADGFGFAFPRGSPLVPDVSRAILQLTESKDFIQFEKELYGNQSCPDKTSDFASNSLGLNSFWGLFLITGATSIVALILFFVFFYCEHRSKLKNVSSGCSLRQRISIFFKLYDQRGSYSYLFEDKEQVDGNVTGLTTPSTNNGSQSPSSLSNHTHGNVDQDDGAQTCFEFGGTRGHEIADPSDSRSVFLRKVQIQSTLANRGNNQLVDSQCTHITDSIPGAKPLTLQLWHSFPHRRKIPRSITGADLNLGGQGHHTP